MIESGKCMEVIGDDIGVDETNNNIPCLETKPSIKGDENSKRRRG
jgi:hypothetical protein